MVRLVPAAELCSSDDVILRGDANTVKDIMSLCKTAADHHMDET